MSEVLTVAFYAEGSTDYTFIPPIIDRTIKEIILQSDKDIEIYPIIEIPKKKQATSYIEEIYLASEEAYISGAKCLIIHCDADNKNIDHVMQYKIKPAFDNILSHKHKSHLCCNLIPLIPIHMTEAWMLSDLELLKSEINALATDNSVLGFTKKPENYSDPKEIIKNAISITQQSKTKHRRTLNISELYSPLGKKINLSLLSQLESYNHFYNGLLEICLPYCLNPKDI